ncbi:unnamed protein product [Gongylonema pulchrum]|uniref:Uncharacterized protein n=1 Tax=Gongylonema pulchrum TaxID=637853 RepID=A0A3P7M482_9BILA|nr:unnamed protein product [Gongylonema pulchrum]
MAKDPELECFDESKFVFTDLSFGLGVRIRSVVVRETDGTLRSASPEERDRMGRVYRGHPHRPVNEPQLFKQPYLQMALDRDDHEYVLDWACHYYLPDDPVFIELCHMIYDQTVEANKFANLHSTRHFGPFVFYLVLNKKFLPLLRFYAAEGRLVLIFRRLSFQYKDAANLIRLIKIIFPDEAWNRTMENADDQTVLQEYAKENEECEPVLQELLRARRSRQMRDKANANDSSETEDADTSAAQVSISFSFLYKSSGPPVIFSSKHFVT